MIHDSPSKIYHIALPFSPSLSWLREAYSSVLSQEVKVVKGLYTGWGACSRTVFFDDGPIALACWKDLIAVGSVSGNITILNGITGISMSVLSNHTEPVQSLAFSSDGTFLASGSDDGTVCLWDIQTGGVISTLYGHTEGVTSISISPDCTMIASASSDETIWLWNAQTGKCHCVINEPWYFSLSISFSPTDSQSLWSTSVHGTVRQWDIEGHQIESTYEGHQIESIYEGNYIAFSSDGSKFVLWGSKKAVAIYDSDSGRVIAKLRSGFDCCCFSPDGRFIAGSRDKTIYVWNISNSDPYLVESFIGHTEMIYSLVFSSSLISLSRDKSIKFWQISTSSMDPVPADSESTPVDSEFAQIELYPILSISLQATEGIAISSNRAGVVKIWDILTGLCKESFQIPNMDHRLRDAQLMDGRVTLVSLEPRNKKMYVWDIKRREPLQMLDVQVSDVVWDFRISGDKSKVFVLDDNSIQALSIVTGEVVGKLEFEGKPLEGFLVIDGSRVWVYFEDLQVQGWDFGLLGPTPVPLSNTPHNRPHVWFIGTSWQEISPSRIEDTLIRKEIFQLPGRYAKPYVAQWDGQYLIAGYVSGEVLILDFSHRILQ